MQKMIDYANQLNKISYKYAFLFDKLSEEREKGNTVNVSMKKLETSQRIYSIINSPGHRDYINNMINGASQADTAVLVVNAEKDRFEEGISINSQTREHAIISHAFNIKNIIVVFNKMDDKTDDYSNKRFNEIKNKMEDILLNISYTTEQLQFIPISGLDGDNLVNKSSKMRFWNGCTLIEMLNNIKTPVKPINKPLRIPVYSKYFVKGIGTIPCGCVDSGILNTGDKVVFSPGSNKSTVSKIKMYGQCINKATPGSNINFQLEDPINIEIGDVCGDLDSPPVECSSFTADMVISNQSKKIRVGYQPIFCCHAAHVACTFSRIIQTTSSTSKKVTKNPDCILQGEHAVVVIKPREPLVVEEFDKYPGLGCFVVRDMKQTVAVGVIRNVERKPIKNK